nr:MAG TPA: hypothetical protein [Caudoviricetes sp.]
MLYMNNTSLFIFWGYSSHSPVLPCREHFPRRGTPARQNGFYL